MQAPNEAARLQIFSSILAADTLSPDVSMNSLATQTAALVASDLVNLCERARRMAVARLLNAE